MPIRVITNRVSSLAFRANKYHQMSLQLRNRAFRVNLAGLKYTRQLERVASDVSLLPHLRCPLIVLQIKWFTVVSSRRLALVEMTKASI